MVLRLEGSWSLLVGKKFLSLSEEDDRPWDVSRVLEWPWKSGRIRAVSHTDISKQDLKVTGNFGSNLLSAYPVLWQLRVRACGGCAHSYIYMQLLG